MPPSSPVQAIWNIVQHLRRAGWDYVGSSGDRRPQAPSDGIRGRTIDALIHDDLAHFERQVNAGLGLPPPVERRPYQVPDRVIEQIQADEDQAIFDAIDLIVSEDTFAVSIVDTPADPRAVMRPLQRADLDQARELIEQHALLPGSIYVASEPEFVGRFPVRSELTVLGPDPVRPRAPVSERLARGEAAHRVMVPEFEIASNPTVRIGDIRSRRFDLIDRNALGSSHVQARRIWESFLHTRATRRAEEAAEGPCVLDD